jgi:hypothetical protein
VHRVTLVLAILLVAVTPIEAAKAQQVTVTHHFRIAASAQAYFTDEDADDIIKKMNSDLQTKFYAWDTTCPGVRFERDGHVFSSSKLLDNGSFNDLVQSLKQNAPTANVLVVAGIDCDGITAAGCGPIGGEPEIVRDQWPDFNDQIWLHERGHNMGLPHSAEGPDDDTKAPENVGKRIMFWQLGTGHYGKILGECAAFRNLLYASETVTDGQPGSLGAAAAPGTNSQASVAQVQPAAPPPGSLPGGQAPYPDFKKQEEEIIAKTGLTPAAFKVVGIPWLEGPPIAPIKALKNDDAESIRNFLKRSPSPDQYTAQAVTVLGLVGTQSDAELLAQPLASPMPAVPPGALDASARQQLRWLAASKNASVTALGLLAARTRSQEAVKALESNLDLNTAANSVGPASAERLSESALETLSKSGTPAAKATVEQALEAANKIRSSGLESTQSTTTNIQTSTGNVVTIPIPSDEQIEKLRGNLARGPVTGLQ